MEKEMTKTLFCERTPGPWHGERELIELRDEAAGLLDKFFEQYGSCIVRGCEAVGDRITPGVVALAGMDGDRPVFRLLRFAGAEHVERFPVYLALHREVLETEPESVRPIAFRYEVRLHATHPGLPCLVVDRDGGREFTDAVQDEEHRFVTDAERTAWNRSAAGTAALHDRLRQAVPVGTILTFASERLSEGWLPCDGRPLGKQAYAALYTAIGDRFGSDAGTFRLPDLRNAPDPAAGRGAEAALIHAIRVVP